MVTRKVVIVGNTVGNSLLLIIRSSTATPSVMGREEPLVVTLMPKRTRTRRRKIKRLFGRTVLIAFRGTATSASQTMAAGGRAVVSRTLAGESVAVIVTINFVNAHQVWELALLIDGSGASISYIILVLYDTNSPFLNDIIPASSSSMAFSRVGMTEDLLLDSLLTR